MRTLVALALVALPLAGCLAPTEEVALPAETTPAPDAPAVPEILAWKGNVVTSVGEGPLSHVRPTEDLTWGVQKQGILVEVPEGVTEMEVALSWSGAGRFMIMLHSHKEHGSNDYVEHVSEMDDENPKCIRVPAEDVVPGVWQVMVHSSGARMVDFTLEVLTVGGATSVVDDRHGHWLQDGSFQVDEHEVEPCALFVPA